MLPVYIGNLSASVLFLPIIDITFTVKIYFKRTALLYYMGRRIYRMNLNGKPLKNIRELQGLTRCELSKISGISESTIKNIEYGKSNPSYDTLVLLADALEIPLDILCNRNLDAYHAVYNSDGSITIKYENEENIIKLAKLLAYLQLRNEFES